ncbi:uridine phosphorylase [Reichenbachiella faecimaris]|uniref:Uridine phosphorylase n=1 Tax=Reichenbachiella faecimaris TaxID=692418 RepID=A0A1W2GBT8_REIFA|nr:nucleoside phosphorylase [Reichenbachiella faecimaris]SMD34093.1 uridine phosphorylase [Reichenbachiella faecimaris]
MTQISETDLILNSDGSVYHLNLKPEDITDTIITVGDPDRVEKISNLFDQVDFKKRCREFVTHRGVYQGKQLTVMSTGMGTDNIEIFLNELDALANIDLTTRAIKEKKTSLRIIRIGTSGSMQEDIPVGSLLATDMAVGLDTLMCYYELQQTDVEQSISMALQSATGLPFAPYAVAGSLGLKDQLAFDMIHGNTATCPGFYGPQGRTLRAENKLPAFMDVLNQFRHNDFRLTNFEMETAGYYALGRILGHEVLSLNAILANRVTHKFAQEPGKIVDDLIKKVLDRI